MLQSMTQKISNNEDNVNRNQVILQILLFFIDKMNKI